MIVFYLIGRVWVLTFFNIVNFYKRRETVYNYLSTSLFVKKSLQKRKIQMYAAEFTLELSTQTLSLLCKVSFHLFSGSQAAVVLQTFCSRCLCVSSPRPPISSVIIFLK